MNVGESDFGADTAVLFQRLIILKELIPMWEPRSSYSGEAYAVRSNRIRNRGGIFDSVFHDC